MRALSTAASRRGLDPTINSASALVDARNGRVEQIAGAAQGRIDRRAILPRVDIDAAQAAHQILERVHLLDAREIADDGADALAARRLHFAGDDGEGFLQDAARKRPFSRT